MLLPSAKPQFALSSTIFNSKETVLRTDWITARLSSVDALSTIITSKSLNVWLFKERSSFCRKGAPL